MLRVYSARVCGLALLVGAPYLHAQGFAPFDAAAAFGARADVTALRLSPDGQRVAFVAPYKGQGSVATTLSLTPGAKPKVAFYTDGKPFRVRGAVVESTRMADALKAAGAQSELDLQGGGARVGRWAAVRADGSGTCQGVGDRSGAGRDARVFGGRGSGFASRDAF